MMANEGRHQALGVPAILREALKIPRRDGKLMVSLSLLLLAPYSLLLCLHDVAVGPLMDDDSDGGGEDLAGRGGLGRLLFLESSFLLAFCTISLSAMALTMYASSVTYTGNIDRLGLKDTIRRSLSSWKRPVKTCCCVAATTVAYVCLVLISVWVLSLVTTGGTALVASIVFLGSSAALLYAFLAVVWMLGFAVSVIEEDDCCGVDALARAAELVRGRELVGFLLMVLMLLLGAPVSLLLYLNAREDDQGVVVRVVVGIVGAALACLVKVFAFMAFTVFYHECRDYHGEKPEGREMYRLLSNTVRGANPSP